MQTDEWTGINYPDPGEVVDKSQQCALLDAVASNCATHLLEGGYFSDLEANALLSGYQRSLISEKNEGHPSNDFVAFAAEAQAEKHFLTTTVEVSRMQKILRWSLSDRVRLWTFGPLPGAVDSLYGRSRALQGICRLLGCPALMVGENSIVHVASVNPVAALVAAAWLKADLAASHADGESPFLFPLMVDMASWQEMLKTHFLVS